MYPVSRASDSTINVSNDDTTEADYVTKECFICTKPVCTSTCVEPATAEWFTCDCLKKNNVHQACFVEWFKDKSTCPLCLSAARTNTDAIRLHIQETVETVQQEAQEMIHRKNRRQLVIGALGVCVILCVFAFLLLHHNPDHHEDDDWQHTHDDDDRATPTSGHTQGTTPGIWHISRE